MSCKIPVTKDIRFVSFKLSKTRVLECWISGRDGLFRDIRDTDVPFIEQIVLSNLKKYWSIAKTRIGPDQRHPHVKCITIHQPSWRKQIARIK